MFDPSLWFIAVAFALAILIALVGWLLEDKRLECKRNKLRQSVFYNLDSAVACGHFEPGESCDGMTAEDLAYDLTCHAVDFEAHEPAYIEPYVREWLQARYPSRPDLFHPQE